MRCGGVPKTKTVIKRDISQMPVKYPESWRGLQLPQMREVLLDTLRELSDPAYQRAAWVEHSVDQNLIVGIDQVYHTLFDDTDLAQDINSCIGVLLFDSAEVEVIRPLVDLLERLLSDLGNAPSIRFIKHPLWPKVVECAERALETLQLKGIPLRK